MKRNYSFMPFNDKEIFDYLLPEHLVNFYIKFALYKNGSSKLYTNPDLFIDVCTASCYDFVSKAMCFNQSSKQKDKLFVANK